jgi:CDP-4-dehydro-6-deoxyglucose reductase/ferredoxin-NAD(P)+ reductase (naphthalene dioxygenase ferredoxin-specific)
MANRPGDPELEFHIRRVPGGAATARIHALLKLGDAVTVEGPFGSSYLREKHAGPILCVAGGSGLAPIKSIVETALAHGMRQPIHVYFGARTERDLYLVDHFQGLEARHTNLTFTPVLSEAAPQPRWRTGLVTDAVGQDLQDLDGWKAYVAGPPAMVDAATAIATSRGLRPQDLHADVFFTPEEAPASRSAAE